MRKINKPLIKYFETDFKILFDELPFEVQLVLILSIIIHN